MNTTKAIRAAFFLAVIAGALMTACKKKEIPGPKGEPGDPGGGGNAGINSSGSFVLALSEWKTTVDSTYWYTHIATPLVTQEVADKGAVKVFMFFDAWAELPYVNGDAFMQYSFVKDTVTLTYADMHGDLPPRPTTTSCRIVTVSEAKKTAAPQPLVLSSDPHVNN